MTPSATVSAAFADERDVDYAVRLIAQSPEIHARYSRRSVIGKRGDIQLVIEVTLADPGQAGRVETCLEGAHGVRMQPGFSVARLAATA